MKELSRRLSKIEMDFYKVTEAKKFIQMMASVVADADSRAGKELATLISERKGEFIRNPATFITALLSLMNKVTTEAREMIFENVVRARDKEREKNNEQVKTDGW